jgi:CrcB protein
VADREQGVTTALLVAFGGALGTLARWGLSTWTARAAGEAFPWGTLLVNVLGCAAIGALAAAVKPGPLRIALQVGVLGGFTTYSAFALETWRLAAGGAPARAALYVLATNAACLAAVWLGARGGAA